VNAAATFKATLAAHGSTPYLIVPSDVATVMDLRGRVTVNGTINGVGFERRSIHPWDKRFFIEVPLRLCRQARVAVGDHVEVTVQIVGDTVPVELTALLDADPTAHDAWAALTGARQRQLANQVAEARRPDTRRRRATACVQALTHPDD
jgi:hypothetical protein